MDTRTMTPEEATAARLRVKQAWFLHISQWLEGNEANRTLLVDALQKALADSLEDYSRDELVSLISDWSYEGTVGYAHQTDADLADAAADHVQGEGFEFPREFQEWVEPRS